jgi:hypothetical protein
MSIWPQDLSKNTLEEVVSFHAENLRTSKHVEFRTKTIIERKLAGKINREEYLAERKLATEDAAECVRRRTLLLAELGRRENWCDDTNAGWRGQRRRRKTLPRLRPRVTLNAVAGESRHC